MDLGLYIKQLHQQRADVDEAIKALEAIAANRMANGQPLKRGRGRPRKSTGPTILATYFDQTAGVGALNG